MLAVPDDVTAALADSSVTTYTTAVAQYGDRQAQLNVQQESGSFTWDATASAVQCTGDIRVFGYGGPLVPRSRDDLLAPYGQEIAVSKVLVLRQTEVTIPLGVFRIRGNDGGRFNLRDGITLDWEVGVDLNDRMRMLERGKIVNPASPVPGASMYDELRRLGLFPIVETVDDVSVPSMVYEDRLSGVRDLCALAGAKPRVNRQGALELRVADRWLTADRDAPDFSFEGTVEWSDEQTDDFYNTVWAHSPDGQYSAFATLTDDSDPRSVNRAGPSTYEHSSPVYTSQAAALAGAQTALQRLLNRRSRTVTVMLDARALLLDLGDVGWVEDVVTGRRVFGEVSKISIPVDPTGLPVVGLTVAEEA